MVEKMIDWEANVLLRILSNGRAGLHRITSFYVLNLILRFLRFLKLLNLYIL